MLIGGNYFQRGGANESNFQRAQRASLVQMISLLHNLTVFVELNKDERGRCGSHIFIPLSTGPALCSLFLAQRSSVERNRWLRQISVPVFSIVADLIRLGEMVT